MSPIEGNAGYPSQYPGSTCGNVSPGAAASFSYGGRVSPTGAGSAPGAGQGPLLPPVGDDDGPPMFPYGAGAIVAEARAAAASPEVEAPALASRNVRRLGGLPPAA